VPPATPLPGTENHFGLAVADKVAPDRRARLRLVTRAALAAAVAAAGPSLVVVGNWADASDREDWIARTEAAGYRLLDTIGNARIYAR